MVYSILANQCIQVLPFSLSLSFHQKRLTNQQKGYLFKAGQVFKKIFPILPVAKQLYPFNTSAHHMV
jgi:hypothetical protein